MQRWQGSRDKEEKEEEEEEDGFKMLLLPPKILRRFKNIYKSRF
jgi:hypothetical protein